MSLKKVFGILICGILLICMTAVVHRITIRVHLARLSNVMRLNPSEERRCVSATTDTNREKLSGLQVLEPARIGNQSNVRCVSATIGNLSFPMCVYNPESDRIVSKLVVAGKYYDIGLVQKSLQFFRMHPDVSFVDLGANLGTYSLPIAHSGIHVISVEPNQDTVRRLAKSVHLGRIASNVVIFHYALSDEESTTFLKFDAFNRGDTFMVGSGSCPGCLSVNVTVLDKLIPFIRHKKAFIKIDTQGAEIKTFQRQSAAKFFNEIEVVMIQMEWVLYPKRYGRTEDGRRRIDRFLEFFYQRGYDVYDPRTEKKLNTDWIKWSYDVLFKKNDLPKNQLFRI